MSYRVVLESDITTPCMKVQQQFYADQNISQFEKHTEAFYRVLEAKFNVLPYENTKYVEDKDPTNMLGLDFEDKVFKAKSDQFIDNETVLQKYDYYCGEHDETNTCIDIQLIIR